MLTCAELSDAGALYVLESRCPSFHSLFGLVRYREYRLCYLTSCRWVWVFPLRVHSDHEDGVWDCFCRCLKTEPKIVDGQTKPFCICQGGSWASSFSALVLLSRSCIYLTSSWSLLAKVALSLALLTTVPSPLALLIAISSPLSPKSFSLSIKVSPSPPPASWMCRHQHSGDQKRLRLCCLCIADLDYQQLGSEQVPPQVL